MGSSAAIIVQLQACHSQVTHMRFRGLRFIRNLYIYILWPARFKFLLLLLPNNVITGHSKFILALLIIVILCSCRGFQGDLLLNVSARTSPKWRGASLLKSIYKKQRMTIMRRASINLQCPVITLFENNNNKSWIWREKRSQNVNIHVAGVSLIRVCQLGGERDYTCSWVQ